MIGVNFIAIFTPYLLPKNKLVVNEIVKANDKYTSRKCRRLEKEVECNKKYFISSYITRKSILPTSYTMFSFFAQLYMVMVVF